MRKNTQFDGDCMPRSLEAHTARTGNTDTRINKKLTTIQNIPSRICIFLFRMHLEMIPNTAPLPSKSGMRNDQLRIPTFTVPPFYP